MGTLRVILGIFCVLASWIVLGITEFNCAHVFLNPGESAPAASNLTEWLAFVGSNWDVFVSYIAPDKNSPIIHILLWGSPAIAIAASWRTPRLQLAVLIPLLLLLAMEIAGLLSFDGYNTGNGGYDGGGEMGERGLHLLLGYISVGVIVIALAAFISDAFRKQQRENHRAP